MELYEKAEKKIRDEREELELNAVARELICQNRELEILEENVVELKERTKKLKTNDYKFVDHTLETRDKNGNYPLSIEYIK